MQAGWLCGIMFGLPLYRHRLFETNWPWMQPGHPKHRLNLHPRAERWVYGGTVKGLPGGMAGVDAKPRLVETATIKTRTELAGRVANQATGHMAGWRIAAAAMGVEWMDRDGTSQAVPPVYCEYLGTALMALMSKAPD